jgi:hypothetical protein
LTIIILLLIADRLEIRFDDRVGNDLEYGDCCLDFLVFGCFIFDVDAKIVQLSHFT